MPSAAAAVLQDREGRVVLRFERLLPHARERVWEALTGTDELAAWHPTPFEIDGERLNFRDDLGGPSMPSGELLVYDPPQALAYTWGGDALRFELSEHADGCMLVLEHTFDDRFKAARDAAGWELCLRALGSSLSGTPARETGDDGRLPAGWAELNRDYEVRFGIAPAEATPPPTREQVEAWKSGARD